MVDVIHYFFEEDMNFSSAEQVEGRSNTREQIYSTMYNRPYKYATKSNKKTETQFSDYELEAFDGGPQIADVKPFDPMKPPTKSYTPPTVFDPSVANPFGGTLDAPMK